MVKNKHSLYHFWKLFSTTILISHNIVCGLSVKTDRPDAIYEIGSKVTFIVTSDSNDRLEYVLSCDGKDVISKGTVECNGNTAGIEGTLDKPGFLLCKIYNGNKQKLMASAAFEPYKIKPADCHMPSDFNLFWNKKKSQLMAIPMKPVLVRDSNDEDIEIYDVNIACIGMPVRGYYAKPVDAVKKNCPAIIFFQGAGVLSAGKGLIKEYSKLGFIAMEINAHGLPNGQTKEFYQNISDATLKNYQYFGRESSDTSYFTGMFLRVFRAMEFLKSQPEWDGKNLIAYGSSQGGAQAIAAAGLEPDVSFVVAAVPAMCDHGGVINGWPCLVPVNKDGSYECNILSASKYIDCVNFACNITCHGFFTVGFIDRTCRPTSIYAMYNVYKGSKEIINAPLMEHSFPVDHQQTAKKKILERLVIH